MFVCSFLSSLTDVSTPDFNLNVFLVWLGFFFFFFHFLQSLFHLFNTLSFIIKGFANKIIRCIEVDKNKGKSKISV